MKLRRVEWDQKGHRALVKQYGMHSIKSYRFVPSLRKENGY
jgi:hypothetical protein